MRTGTRELFDIYTQNIYSQLFGWDWSAFNDRIVTQPLPWSYRSLVIPYIRTSQFMLDMGTGGGELLSTLGPFPEMICATEGYKPNLSVAKQKLEPMGITVKGYERDDDIPFPTESFDLITNRHESFNAKELERLMIPRGYFVTQQVGSKNDIELNQLIGDNTYKSWDKPWNMEQAANELIEAGFEIQYKDEFYPKTRFFDIGAIIFYVNNIPWQFKDYSFEKYKDILYSLHEIMLEKGFIEVESHRFIIIAQEE